MITLESPWIIQGNLPSQGWQTLLHLQTCHVTEHKHGFQGRMWTGLGAIYHTLYEAQLQLLPTVEHTTFWDGFTVKLLQ